MFIVSIELFAVMGDYDRIHRMCQKRGELWEDPDFPATQSSVFYHQKPPFQFVWKRPKVSINYIYIYIGWSIGQIKSKDQYCYFLVICVF